jgi:hypothetical protein
MNLVYNPKKSFPFGSLTQLIIKSFKIINIRLYLMPTTTFKLGHAVTYLVDALCYNP